MDGEEAGEVLEGEVEAEGVVDLVHPLEREYRWESGGEVSGFLRGRQVEVEAVIQEVHGEEAEGDIKKSDTDIMGRVRYGVSRQLESNQK